MWQELSLYIYKENENNYKIPKSEQVLPTRTTTQHIYNLDSL
jgi:hypothetical protein